MKRIFTLAILSCLFIGSISAESQYRKKTFDLFVTGNILQWEKVIDTMKNDPSCQSIEDKEELLSYYYGLVGHLIDIKDKNMPAKSLTMPCPSSNLWPMKIPKTVVCQVSWPIFRDSKSPSPLSKRPLWHAVCCNTPTKPRKYLPMIPM